MILIWAIAAFRVGSEEEGRRITDPVTALSTWDGAHYTQLATEGYSTEGIEARRIAFFPLLPLLARTLGTREHARLAGVLLSQVLYLVALLLLSDLTHAHRRSDSIWSDPAIWLLVSPLSFFFATFYTESLFLACTLGAVWAAARGKFGWSTFAGFLAGLTRPTAVCVPLLFLGKAVAAARRGEAWRRYLIPAAAPLVGVALYLIAIALATGRFDGYTGVQREFWGVSRAIPYAPLADLLVAFAGRLRDFELLPYDQLVQMGSALSIIALLLWGWRRLPLGWLAYTIVSLLLIHSNIPFRSTARYEVVLFPIFVLIPWTIFARPPIAPFVAGLLVLLQAYLLLKFASWQWVA